MWGSRVSGICANYEEKLLTSSSPVAGDGESSSPSHPQPKIIVLYTICFRRRKTIKKSNLKDIFYAISPRVVTWHPMASLKARSIHLATASPPSALTWLVNIRSLVMFCVGALAFFSWEFARLNITQRYITETIRTASQPIARLASFSRFPNIRSVIWPPRSLLSASYTTRQLPMKCQAQQTISRD